MKYGYFYEIRVDGKPLFVTIFAKSRADGLRIICANFGDAEVEVKG